MRLKADAVNQIASVLIHKRFYKIDKSFCLELLVIIVVKQINIFRCIFIRITKGIPQIIIPDDLMPVVLLLADAAVLHPRLVYHIISVKQINIAKLRQLLKHLTHIALHPGKHNLPRNKRLRDIEIFMENPLRSLAVPDNRMAAHCHPVVARPVKHQQRHIVERHN